MISQMNSRVIIMNETKNSNFDAECYEVTNRCVCYVPPIVQEMRADELLLQKVN